MLRTRGRKVLSSIAIYLQCLCGLILSLVDPVPCRRVEYDIRRSVCNKPSNAGSVANVQFHSFRRDYLETICEPLPAQLTANLSRRTRNQDSHIWNTGNLPACWASDSVGSTLSLSDSSGSLIGH